MKRMRCCIPLILLALLFSCQKKKYPDSLVTNDAVFYFKGTINNRPVSFGAGLNNYYMYSSYAQDSNTVYNFIGDLRPINCTSNCANSVHIQINNFKTSPVNGSVASDSLFSHPQSYGFIKTFPPAYQVSFLSSYNKTPGSYLWDFGDGSTSSQANPVHMYAQAGTYAVCLTINGSNGCSGSICNTQKIGLPGNPCKTAILATHVSGNTITFTQISSGPNPLRYTWDFGDGSKGSGPNPVHTYAIPGAYPVSLNITDGANNKATATYNTLTQNDISSCATNYLVGNITSVSQGGNLNLSAIDFIWTDENGVNYSTKNVVQPANSYFQVTSVSDYTPNEKGELTKKVALKLSCKVSNGSNELTISDAEAVICVSYK